MEDITGTRALFVTMAVVLLLAEVVHSQENVNAVPTTNPGVAKSHSATLHWNPPADVKSNSPATSYNVYRSKGKHSRDGKTDCDKKFKKIANVPSPKTEYTDTKVVAGQVYCYQVKTVLSGRESPPTPSVVAIIPADTKKK